MLSPGRHLRIFVAILLLGVAQAQAQDTSPYGQTVVSVSFEVEGRPETLAAITGLSDVKAGQPLRPADVRATIAHLDNLGRYDDIIPVALAVPGGVAVTFRLVPRHPVTRLEVRGDSGLPPAIISDYIRQRYAGVPTNVRPGDVEGTAANYLSDEGYLDAAVTSAVEVQHEPEGATLVLNVAAGTRATVGGVDVRGRSPLSAAEVIKRTGTAQGTPYRRRAVEAALTTIEDDLREQGFYEAQATLQQRRSTTGVDLVIAVDAGPLVDVRVAPADALPASQDQLIPVKQLGSVDLDLLEDSSARIVRELKKLGYWRATAPFTRELDPSGERLVVTFNVTRGPQYFIDRIDIPSGLELPGDRFGQLLGVHPGELFNEELFVSGLSAVTAAYRLGGFYRAEAKPSYEEVPGGTADRALVVLHPNVTEGPRGVISDVTLTFAGEGMAIPDAELRASMVMRAGRPFVEAERARDERTLQNLFLDRGFRRASLVIRADLRNDGRDVAIIVNGDPGQQIRVGQISVIGNDRVSEQAIRDEMQLSIGQPAGVTAINQAQTRLFEMGVFRRVNITSADQFTEPDTRLIVNVVESRATTIGFGGGVEAGRATDELTDVAPHGFFEITRRGLGGRNRSISFFTRVSLRRDLGEFTTTVPEEMSAFGFTEYRLSATYRERRAFHSETDLLLGLTSEQARRTSFDFTRQTLSAEGLRVLTPVVTASARYTLAFTRLFDERFGEDEQPVIDRAFPEVRLSKVSTGLTWDRTDSFLSPTRGTRLAGDFEVAARSIGSEVGFVKTSVSGSAYRAITPSRRTILAGRVELGLAQGFARTAVVVDADGVPIETIVDDLPASERFFTGGGNSVRGFQIDRLAVPELLTTSGLPLGGNALVVMNAEVRRPVRMLFGRQLSGVAFIDAGNVFKRVQDLDLKRIRGTFGTGVRYNSPIGAIRLDFGFKMQRLQLGGRREKGWEFHLSIGEAF